MCKTVVQYFILRNWREKEKEVFKRRVGEIATLSDGIPTSAREANVLDLTAQAEIQA